MLKLILRATFFFLLLLAGIAFAQTVQKINNQALLLQGVPPTMKEGDEFITVNEAHKRTALIKVTKIKGDRAVARILKGTAVIGETLIPRQTPRTPPTAAQPPPAAPTEQASAEQAAPAEKEQADMENIRPTKRKIGKNYFGVLLGYSMDNLAFTAGDNAVPAGNLENAVMVGSSFKLKGFWDHQLGSNFTLRVMSGYDGFNGTYTAVNPIINKDGAATSNLIASFITAEGEILWNFYKTGLTTMWVGGGYALDYVMSWSSNMYSLQLSSSTLSSVFAGVGSNVEIDDKSYIPIYLHYNYYAAGSGVTQTALNFGVGYGWSF